MSPQKIKINEWESVEPLESFEENSIDSFYRQHPVDLSRDIYVNEIMANRGVPPNPDAEVFNIPIVQERSAKLVHPR